MSQTSGGSSLRRYAAAGATAGAVVLSARALLRPRAGEPQGTVDWAGAREIAVRRSGEADDLAGGPARRRMGLEYDVMASELAQLMAELCQSRPERFPSITVLDRRGFIDANMALARRLIDPIERMRASLPESRATALGRTVVTRYVGELFGMVSRRVLGQYDPVLSLAPQPEPATPSALYVVESNVVAFERGQNAPALSLRRWLILHELTHAWQFEDHPWLRDHIAGLMNGIISTGLAAVEPSARPSARARLAMLPSTARAQVRGISRIQAVMSVLEGHANFVMHRAGRRHIDGFERLEAAFHRRRKEVSPLERLLSALTGMNMKLRQYELGEQFAEAVMVRGGLSLLNRVWEGPEQMPTLAELRRPERWVARIG